jgi:hypothetical protein
MDNTTSPREDDAKGPTVPNEQRVQTPKVQPVNQKKKFRPVSSGSLSSNVGEKSRSGDPNQEAIKRLTQIAKPKGIGNSNFGAMHDITIDVSPSVICKAYAKELYDSMLTTIVLNSGNPNATLWFTESDLYVYMSILLRERVKDVRKERTLFSRSDGDIKIPHFYYLALYEVGDVVDEQRHLWLKVRFNGTQLAEIQDEWASIWSFDEAKDENVADEKLHAQWKRTYHVYEGEASERDFVYSMSKSLKMMERWGFVNGSALPRGLTGELSFMLFMWMEEELQHPDPGVEPGLAMLASLLAFSRNVTLLNPYIGYGPENAYKILLKEVTTPRGQTS